MSALDQLRGWWAGRHGLSPASRPTTIEDCLKQTGWLPTSGAPTAYISIRARVPGASRGDVDRVAMDGVAVTEVHALPGRPFLLVPPAEVPFALRLFAARFQAHVASNLASGRITESAFRAVSKQVCAALEECPLSTTDIRKGVTHRDAGSLLTIALSDLMLRGIVRRFPADGRIDSTKYQFELRHPDDRPNLDVEGDDEAVTARGLEHFLRHYGPATIKEFVEWGDTTRTPTRRALEAIKAEAVRISGWDDDAWLLPADAGRWRSFKPQTDDRIAFLPYRDPFVHFRRTPALLTGIQRVEVLNTFYGKLSPAAIDDVTGLNHHVITCGNQLVGIWEYDLKARAVVTRLWDSSARLQRRMSIATEEMTVFIREQLGDAKLSAVDPPEKRAVRLAFCRQR